MNVAAPNTMYVRHPKIVHDHPAGHKDRVVKDLQRHGMNGFALRRMASRLLPSILHADEAIGGVVYGHSDGGSAMLVATDRRVIFLDKKPLFVNQDELTYYVVSGISYGHGAFASTVTLHTRIKDYKIRTFNQTCAQTFVDYIESHCLERNSARLLTGGLVR